MKKIILSITMIFVCFLSGCVNEINYDLPDNPIIFEQKTFTNPDNQNDEYMSITYNNRVYIPYGTLKNSINGNDVKECIGYIKDSSQLDNTQSRVMILNNTEDYLAIFTVESIMEQPFFYRAIDTKNKNITTLDYIYSLNYDFWK